MMTCNVLYSQRLNNAEPNEPTNEAIICRTVIPLRRCVMFYLTATVQGDLLVPMHVKVIEDSNVKG